VEAARPGDRLVLVAEDDSVNQKVILKQLAILGFAAEIAADGAQALRLWRTKTYSALVTDLHMPEMDGYALARAIRAEEPGDCRLPILAVSADALRDTESHALDAGIDAYLTKPVQLQRLGATLEACMAQGRAIAPKIFQAPEPIHERVRLDPSALRELVGDDSKVIVEFLSDFGRSLPRLSGELQELMQAGDRRRLASFAHRMKSTSFSMGSGALGEVCADLENAAPRCSEADLSRLVGAVHEAMDDAARAIAEYLEMLNLSATL
jgi:CheY-like chemotaxis protein